MPSLRSRSEGIDVPRDLISALPFDEPWHIASPCLDMQQNSTRSPRNADRGFHTASMRCRRPEPCAAGVRSSTSSLAARRYERPLCGVQSRDVYARLGSFSASGVSPGSLRYAPEAEHRLSAANWASAALRGQVLPPQLPICAAHAPGHLPPELCISHSVNLFHVSSRGAAWVILRERTESRARLVAPIDSVSDLTEVCFVASPRYCPAL